MREARQLNVSLHIDRLILHGLEGIDAQRLGRVLAVELRRQIAAGVIPLLTDSRDVARVDAGAIDVRASFTPDVLGRETAAAVYTGLRVLPESGGGGPVEPGPGGAARSDA